MTWVDEPAVVQGSIICLESAVEQDYSWFLSEFIAETKESQDADDVSLIRSFWNNEDSWEDILEKTSYEDSRWYVWWMDGVRAYIRHEFKEAENDTT